MRLPLLLLLLSFQPAFSQNSTFDFGNDGWTADEDAENGAAAWQSTGGNPGGHVRGVDGSIGGTWYFVAPAKYRGIKCDAYGHFLRYDQFASAATSPGNKPDVEIKGANLTLVFNNPVLPGTSWTHYDILLREDAGWRLTTLTGLTPTAAQFKQVLANVTSLRIRGEYVSGGDDFGGLDNVVLESNFFFNFDLDEDDSSGAVAGDYQSPASCIPTGNIVGSDVLLNATARIDSIFIRILGGSALEELALNTASSNILVTHPAPGIIVLVNIDTASTAAFVNLLKSILYIDHHFTPASGVRVVQIQVYTDCGSGETHRSYLPIFVQPYAGTPGDTVLCFNSGPMDLRTVLRGGPDDNGSWEPPLFSGTNLFDPNLDTAGTYTYIVPKAEPCLGDTNAVVVKIHYPFQLRTDTTVCYDEPFFIEAPRGLVDWTWSDGSRKLQLPVAVPGTYTLVGETGVCTFSDSVAIDFFTCVECPPYSPNVFSPNDDGLNDEWHIFLPCRWSSFHLEVYDRWGNLIYTAADPENAWDGRTRGEAALSGVYVWRMRWTGELFGVPKTWQFEGDVTIVR